MTLSDFLTTFHAAGFWHWSVYPLLAPRMDDSGPLSSMPEDFPLKVIFIIILEERCWVVLTYNRGAADHHPIRLGPRDGESTELKGRSRLRRMCGAGLVRPGSSEIWMGVVPWARLLENRAKNARKALTRRAETVQRGSSG